PKNQMTSLPVAPNATPRKRPAALARTLYPQIGRWRAFAASPLASMIELAKTEAEDDLRTQTFALQRFSEFREMRFEDRRYSSAPISQLGAG
ncbi:MAG: hypothetical protein M3453_11845, partial [Pseudomonadota bacterium]|nr:hypothetical protein [Pseudomonadota bacterium]